jgi:hypothetical protein
MFNLNNQIMKNFMTMFLSVILGILVFSGCNKQNDETEVEKTLTINADFQAEGQSTAEAGPYFAGNAKGDDIISASIHEYSNVWTPMPYTDDDGNYWFYRVTDSGAMYFYCRLKSGYVFTQDFTVGVKIRYRVRY